MSLKSLTMLVLAAGFAAAKPLNVPEALPGYKRAPIDALGNNSNNNNQFSFINGFQNLQNQQQVVQVQQQNFELVNNNGIQQAVFEQVNQVLVVDGQKNGFNNKMNDLFRQANARNGNKDVTTVIMVVTEVKIAVADGKGNQLQSQVFAQSLLVANRGKKQTESVMIFDSRTLIAQDIIGNGNNKNGNNVAGIGGINGVAGATATGASLATKTRGVQLLGAKPTWSSVVDDPAATQVATWRAEIEDLQNSGQDAQDNDVNNALAEQLKAAQDAVTSSK